MSRYRWVSRWITVGWMLGVGHGVVIVLSSGSWWWWAPVAAGPIGLFALFVLSEQDYLRARQSPTDNELPFPRKDETDG